MQDTEKTNISEVELCRLVTLSLCGFGVTETAAADAAKVLVMRML